MREDERVGTLEREVKCLRDDNDKLKDYTQYVAENLNRAMGDLQESMEYIEFISENVDIGLPSLTEFREPGFQERYKILQQREKNIDELI